jgi:hypothetical protein
MQNMPFQPNFNSDGSITIEAAPEAQATGLATPPTVASVAATLPPPSPQQSKPIIFPDARSLRDYITNYTVIPEELVYVADWNTEILVKGMTAKDRNRIIQNAMPQTIPGQAPATPNMSLVYVDMVIASCYHPVTGEKLFETAHRDMLNAKSSRAIDALTDAVGRLSGTTPQAKAELSKN